MNKATKEEKAQISIDTLKTPSNIAESLGNKKETNPIKLFFMRLIHLVYYYVPPCPVCESRRTGKFFSRHMRAVDNEYIVMTSLKNGEIATPIDELDPENQAFCLNCGYTWDGPISTKFFSLKRIEEEKRVRGTKEMYSEILSEKNEEEKEKKFKTLRKFIGRF